MNPGAPFYSGPTGPFYSEAFFAKLSALIDLSDSDIEILEAGLERSALHWHMEKVSAEEEAAPNAYIKELGKLYRDTKEAAQTLRTMPEGLWAVLRQTYDMHEEYVRAPHVAFAEDGNFGERAYTIVDGQSDPSDHDKKTLQAAPRELAHFLESLSWLAEQPAILFPPKQGPRQNRLLILWLTTVASFWTKELGRPFVRGYITKGLSNSDAAILCRAAYHELDPHTPESLIENEMKKLISRSRGKFV